MTREQAKELLPIIKAYSEGKVIQYRHRGMTTWYDLDSAQFNCDINLYRIKTEPKYKPFKTKEECWTEMLKHQPFGWVKEISTEMLYLINGMTNTSIVTMENINSFEEAINIYKFKDGEPFGIKEE